MHSGHLHSLFKAIACLACETKFAAHPIVSHLAIQLMYSATSTNLHIEGQHRPLDSEVLCLS